MLSEQTKLAMTLTCYFSHCIMRRFVCCAIKLTN